MVVAGLYSAERRVGALCEGVMWKRGAIKRREVKEGRGGGGGRLALVPGCIWRAAR